MAESAHKISKIPRQVPRKSPFDIVIPDHEREALEKIARSYTSPYIDVLRARIVLHAADGLSNKAIGERLDTPRQIVSKWRKRFFERRLAALGDEPRSGGPRGLPAPRDVVVALKALACEIPHETGLPLSRLSGADIRREAIACGIVADIGGTTIWRWLHEDAIKPWTHRSWVFPAIRSSPPRPDPYSISTRAVGRASRSPSGTSYYAPTRSPASWRADEDTLRARRREAADARRA